MPSDDHKTCMDLTENPNTKRLLLKWKEFVQKRNRQTLELKRKIAILKGDLPRDREELADEWKHLLDPIPHHSEL